MGPAEVVVLDTNVLVSALGWSGPEHRVYRACRAGNLRMATSNALLAELGRVLMYPKLGFEKRDVAEFLADVCSHALIVSPTETVDAVADQADNRVLECAIAARAHWVVSGDRDLLALGQFRGIRIETSSGFLASKRL